MDIRSIILDILSIFKTFVLAKLLRLLGNSSESAFKIWRVQTEFPHPCSLPRPFWVSSSSAHPWRSLEDEIRARRQIGARGNSVVAAVRVCPSNVSLYFSNMDTNPLCNSKWASRCAAAVAGSTLTRRR